MAQLRGKAQCPNTVAEQNGTSEANKKSGIKCTHWVDRNKTECGGSHSFEDHEAALAKFRPKGKGEGKARKAKMVVKARKEKARTKWVSSRKTTPV